MIKIREWEKSSNPSHKGIPISAVAIDPNRTDTSFIGYRSELSESGAIDIGKIDLDGSKIQTETTTFPFMSLFMRQPWAKSFNLHRLRESNTYPVNTISFIGEKLFIGVPGGTLYSEDNGASWKVLSLGGLIPNNTGTYPGDHKGCKGFVMEGWKEYKFGGFMDVCDILVDKDGVFYMASSHYLISLQNGLDAYLEDPSDSNNAWKGVPPAGERGELTFGTVNHDVEVVKGKLFSASDKGLLVSDDKGRHWSQGGISDSVYSVKADKENGKLYVGGKDKMYTCDLKGRNCETLPGIKGPIYDVNVGTGALFAATGNGIKLSRDKGQTWLDITNGKMKGAKRIEQIATGKRDQKEIILVATDIGTFYSFAEVE